MKNRRLITMVAAVMLIGMASAVYWLTQPCQPFARLSANIACPQSTINFPTFRPIDGQAVSPPDAEGVANIYGWVDSSGTGDSSAARIRFNIHTGKEIGREPMPYLNGNRWHMGFSKDGERAVITCFGTEPCSTDGWRRAIISVDDTKPIEPLDTPVTDNDPLRFPGEPQPSVVLTEAARFAADGQRIVFIDANGDVWLQSAEGQPIAVLFDDPRPRRGFAFLNALSVSPSGAYVALLNASHNMPSLLIWETGKGTLLARIELQPRAYAIDIDPMWSRDENHIGIVRNWREATNTRETALDIYAWR